MVLTIIKMYRYIVYVEIFVTVNCGTGRDNGHHSNPKFYQLSRRCGRARLLLVPNKYFNIALRPFPIVYKILFYISL